MTRGTCAQARKGKSERVRIERQRTWVGTGRISNDWQQSRATEERGQRSRRGWGEEDGEERNGEAKGERAGQIGGKKRRQRRREKSRGGEDKYKVVKRERAGQREEGHKTGGRPF